MRFLRQFVSDTRSHSASRTIDCQHASDIDSSQRLSADWARKAEELEGL